MSADEPLILTLARAVLDGEAPDWASLASDATESHRALFAEFQAIAAIRSLSRCQPKLPLSVVEQPLAGSPTWGPLRILEPIGRGGFGAIYRAWDTKLDREVALKLLPADDEGESALEEGRLLARVHHRNVVTIFGADRIGPYVGLWMEYVHGDTLEQVLIRDGTLAPTRVALIGRHLCDALTAVHQAGLVHRDVKAHNVMLEPGGRLVLMDFGAGRVLSRPAADVAGTPLYLAPEIFAGGDVGAASDLYSAAVLLFYLLTARYPVSGRTLKELQAAHREQRVVRLGDLRSDVPDVLREAIETGLAIHPSDRHTTAAAFAAALAPAIVDSTESIANVRSPQRRSSRALMAAAVAGSAGLMLIWIATSDRRAGPGTTPRTGSGIVNTQVWTGPGVSTDGTVSPDGRYLSSVDGDGNLALHDLQTGEDRRLTDVGNSSWSQYAQASAISRDGTRVAYAWYDSSKNRAELRTLTLDAAREAAPRTLLDHPDVNWVLPHDWSPDGKWIAVSLGRRDRTVHIGLISTVNAAFEELAAVDWRGPTRVVFSPDGRFVAYDLPVGDTSPRDVFVMATRTRQVTPAIVHRANDVVAGWAPNGTSLLFTSDRSGSIGVWEVPMANGAPVGIPGLLKSDLGSRSFSISVTSAGTLVYGLQTSNLNVYTAELDFEAGRLLAPPAEAVESYLFRNTGPDWSPDGRLAFLSDRPRNVSAITVTSGASPEPVLELRPAMDLFQRVRWAPDGSITVQGTDLAGRRGIFRVDVPSGDVSPILVCEPGVDCVQASITPGGQKLVYLRFTARDSALVVRNLSSATEDILAQQSGRTLNGASLSRDGTQVAYVQSDPVAKASILWVRSLSDGRSRELVRYARPAAIMPGAEWTPDGKHLILAKSDDGAVPNATLWSLRLDGSRPPVQVQGLRPQLGLNMLRVHPDGRRAAFSQGRSGAEVWMLSNFMDAHRVR